MYFQKAVQHYNQYNQDIVERAESGDPICYAIVTCYFVLFNSQVNQVVAPYVVETFERLMSVYVNEIINEK